MANASDLYIMQGASGGADGKRGIVPKPVAGDNVKVLKGDATFGSIVEANITAGTLTTASTATGSKTGADTKFVTGTAGTNNNLVSWNADGDAVDAGISITQARAGQLVGVSESTLGSDSTTTSTSATASGLQVDYTAVTDSNTRYIEGMIDWDVYDATYGTSDNAATGYLELEYSADGAIWNSLKTFTRTMQVSNGKKLVGSNNSVLGAQISTTSTSFGTTGMLIDYTSVNAANDRYISYFGNYEVSRSANNCRGEIELQYSADGSSWSGLESTIVDTSATGATATRVIGAYGKRYLHQVSDGTPHYRVAYKVNVGTNSETLTLYASSKTYLRVEEYATDIVDSNRKLTTFSIKHTATDATPQYRVTHKVAAGDTSKVYTGSVLRVREYNDV